MLSGLRGGKSKQCCRRKSGLTVARLDVQASGFLVLKAKPHTRALSTEEIPWCPSQTADGGWQPCEGASADANAVAGEEAEAAIHLISLKAEKP